MKKTTDKFIILMLTIFSLQHGILNAQNTEVNKTSCLISEFKMTIYSLNIPSVRSESAKNWLLKNGARCSEIQLDIISSNMASWLGTSLTHEIAALVDDLHERKILKSAGNLKDYYSPTVKTTSSVETYTTPTRPSPVVSQSDGSNVVAGGIVNLVVKNQEEKRSDQDEDEPPKGNFTSNDRVIVRSYFDKLRGEKECPDFMKASGEECISVRGAIKQWKLNQSLESGAMATDIPIGLREKLGSPPSKFKFLQVNEDILLVSERGSVVVDMILDFGGIPVKSRSQKKSTPKV